MSERRMFTKKITESDAFLDMPLSTQALYFHLNMNADDDGFVNNPKKIQRMVGASDDDLKVLFAKNFVIHFDSGVIVIKHWRMHNYIQSDRYKPTDYTEEKQMLSIKANKSYTMDVSNLDTDCIQIGRVGKDRLDKDRLDKDRLGKDNNKSASDDAHVEKPSKILLYYPYDEQLDTAFADYVKMRRQIKKPMTQRAIELAIAKLNELSCNNNEKAIEILNQSVMNSWQGLFPLDGRKTTTEERWRNL